jgi:hypothetical protein
MPGETGVTVVTTLVCFFISHARLRARRAPGIPCALCFRGRWLVQNSGASRRESADAYLDVIARSDSSAVAQPAKAESDEAIHVTFVPAVDCFAPLAMTVSKFLACWLFEN